MLKLEINILRVLVDIGLFLMFPNIMVGVGASRGMLEDTCSGGGMSQECWVAPKWCGPSHLGEVVHSGGFWWKRCQ